MSTNEKNIWCFMTACKNKNAVYNYERIILVFCEEMAARSILGGKVSIINFPHFLQCRYKILKRLEKKELMTMGM